MAINIQEILDADSDAQRIDKINYNFDQIVANGGGPIGLTGAKGAPGSVGATGAQGAQGPIGPQGPQGAYTDFFVVDDITEADSIYLKQDTNAQHTSTLTLGDENAISNGSVLDYEDSILRILPNQGVGNNAIRFQTPTDTSKYVDINFVDNGTIRAFEFRTSPIGSSKTVYEFNGSTLNLTSSNVIKVKLDDVESNFISDVKFSGNVSMPETGVDVTGKVITSTNAAGQFAWTDPGVVPIGTIVMAPQFVIANSVDFTTAGNPGYDKIGRGTGDWAGWYWCNGQTWGTYVTPDLRDRFALGYSKNVADSTPSQTGNATAGSKNVTQLTSVSVALPNHTHTTNIGNDTIQEEIDGNPITTSILQPQTGGSSNFISGNPNSAASTTINIAPKTATVIYMIYLEDTNLTYSLAQVGGGGQGVQGA